MNHNAREFSWFEMDQLHRRVAELICRDQYTPDIIIGIVRCGLVSATHLAYLLGVRMVGGLYVRTTASDEILAAKDFEPEIIILTPASCIDDKSVLIVDTVMASGTSITLATNLVLSYKPRQIKLAVIVDWPTSPYNKKTKARPIVDYIGTTVDIWPDFPWEH